MEDDVVTDVIEELEASGRAMRLLWPHVFVPMLTHRASSLTRQAVWTRVVPLARRDPLLRLAASSSYANAALLASCRVVRNDDFALIDAIAAVVADLEVESESEIEKFLSAISE